MAPSVFGHDVHVRRATVKVDLQCYTIFNTREPALIFPNVVAKCHIFGGAHPGAMTPKFELGRDFCTMHLPPRFIILYVYLFRSYHSLSVVYTLSIGPTVPVQNELRNAAGEAILSI